MGSKTPSPHASKITMPLKIKLPAPVAAANIGLTSVTELTKEEETNKTLFSHSSGLDANDFEASGFALPPLPHQGRNHTLVKEP